MFNFDLKERFMRSLVAGFIASITLLGLNLFSYYVLHFSNRRFINYASLMIFGRKFQNLTEAIICAIAQVGFGAGLFVISSYFILKANKKDYFWRGVFIGFGSWFSIMSISYIIGIHKILPINVGSAISFMVTSTIWGIVGAWVLNVLDENYISQTEVKLKKKQKIHRSKRYFLFPAPARKIATRKTVKPKKIIPQKIVNRIKKR